MQTYTANTSTNTQKGHKLLFKTRKSKNQTNEIKEKMTTTCVRLVGRSLTLFEIYRAAFESLLI